ncbi:alternative ribosome rescue aminoacyl-tRNA hydrolase ArfB [Nocardioides sp. GY 10127]|uniref:alternative ribosome rescue aminoacyl-tRNA hydrolase ArfB n=1 Tax=Nocardioides sp. GY 10127 TaxID=2569762 RepID=UPI0010A90148|nr:alternative ribosome rescue aminoacyl-tRNA hydrolase ArfB [Nocardioides sp. GY 10127]TIC80187.1 aminoacyl-tRNA hydrolase [Nocardioides sp. GY 10127]
MADDLPVTRSLTVRGADLTERFSRSSGPGGQGVNTTDSRVELVLDLEAADLPEPTRARLLERLAGRLVDGRQLVVAASEHRAQLDNRRAARERMTALLAQALAPPPKKRRPTKPTRGSQRRRLDAKKQRGEIKKGRQKGRGGDWS